MANKTVTVRPSGGDYTSLQAAITGEVAANADLTAEGMDGILTISIEGSWSSADTTKVVLDGFTTDATHYVQVVADSANRAGTSWDTGKYIHRPIDTDYGHMFKILSYYTRIVGLQIYGHGSVDRLVDLDAYYCTIDSCLIQGTSWSNGAIYVQGDGTKISNTIVFNHGGNTPCFDFNKSGVVYNCVAADGSGVGFQFGSQPIIAKNCYSGGNAGADYAGTGSYAITTCYSEDETLSTPSAAYSTSTFTSVTEGSEDFSLASGSALIDQGTDLSADATYPFDWDITGESRSGTWDVGASEYVASGYELTASGISSATSVGTSTLSQGHVLDASDIASTPSVGSSTLGQEYELGADSTSSASSVGTSTLSNGISFSAVGVASESFVGTPSMTEMLSFVSVSVTSDSSVGAPTLTIGSSSLLADGIYSNFYVGSPSMGQTQTLSADFIASASSVGSPAYTSADAAVGLATVTVAGGVLVSSVTVNTYQPSIVAVGQGV